MSLRDELGAEQYDRMASAVRAYCAYGDSAALCPRKTEGVRYASPLMGRMWFRKRARP